MSLSSDGLCLQGTETMEPASMTGWITNVELPMRDGDQMGRIKAKLLSEVRLLRLISRRLCSTLGAR